MNRLPVNFFSAAPPLVHATGAQRTTKGLMRSGDGSNLWRLHATAIATPCVLFLINQDLNS